MDLVLNIDNVEFEKAGNYFIKVDVLFGSNTEKGQRTEVVATATKRPKYQNSLFRFNIPSSQSKNIHDHI